MEETHERWALVNLPVEQHRYLPCHIGVDEHCHRHPRSLLLSNKSETPNKLNSNPLDLPPVRVGWRRQRICS